MSKSVTSTAGPTYYRPNEVAKILRCSEWWVKEQARKRRIPFSWIGGRYLFTDEHILEIVKIFETWPTRGQAVTVGSHAIPQPRREMSTAQIASLKARPPRRARAAGSQSAA